MGMGFKVLAVAIIIGTILSILREWAFYIFATLLGLALLYFLIRFLADLYWHFRGKNEW